MTIRTVGPNATYPTIAAAVAASAAGDTIRLAGLLQCTDGDAHADIVIIAAGDQRDFSNFVL